MRDSSKMIALGRGMPTINKSEIRIYSSVGEGLIMFTVSPNVHMQLLFLLHVVGPRQDYPVWLDF
jgi:hypothetical protein